jgi:hypothetical protein
MTDEDLLHHCLAALTGQYGDIAKNITVEALRKRLGYQQVKVVDTTSPAEIRRRANAPWNDKASY